MARLIKPNIESNEKEYYWVRYIKSRIDKKKNFLCLVSGQTGGGKSYTCLSVALMLDKNFTADRIVFGLSGLMKLINSGENFPAGTVFVWDEFQIEGSSRNWQSLTNKLLNSLLSTFRHRNFILLINSPYEDFIDSQSRKLLHANWEVTGINYEKEKTIIKPMIVQYNGRRKQFYYKYLRIRTNKGISPVTKWSVPRPPKWITDTYELMKHQFTNNLNKSIERQLNKNELISNKEITKQLTDKQAEVLTSMKELDGNTSLVADKLKMSVRNVQFHIAQARKKGFEWLRYGGVDGN